MNQNENKFFFDLHDFEKEATEEKDKRNNKTPPPPSFSLEDMEEARAVAFEKGKAHGLDLAKDSIEQQTELMVQSLGVTIQKLEAAESARHTDFLNHSVAMTYKALEKMLPSILDNTKEDLMKASLAEFFTVNTVKSEMTLYVHSSMIPSIKKHASSLSNNLIVTSDDKLTTSQARIEWGDGAFEFKPDTLMEQILQTIKGRIVEDQQILDETQKKTHNELISDEISNGEEDS